jgi:transcriptional regulator with XRE-family HTH domain
MVLLRKVIGDALRARRLAQHRTLREVSTAANVSLGYLSEIERGHKEASSELLASICDALGARLSEMLGDVSATFALAEQMDDALVGAVAGHDSDESRAAHAEAGPAEPGTGHAASATEGGVTTVAVQDGDLTVQVHSDGPLRTTLTATRTTPPQRRTDRLLIG